MSAVFPSERIEQTILLLRGHKIILDRDLAAMYGVSTRDLNKAVSRNLDRFPDDFMLQLTRSEFNDLKFQFGTSSWGGTRKLPRAFTEQGIAMLSSVSPKQTGHPCEYRDYESLCEATRVCRKP